MIKEDEGREKFNEESVNVNELMANVQGRMVAEET